jgi:transcriptional regulator with XRE-family HTH domain
MSSSILRTTFDEANMQHGKYRIVRNGREALAELVRGQMASRNWSTYDVVRESGGLITSNSTVWNILNLRVKDVKEATLKGLAKAFKVSEDLVFDTYRGKAHTVPEAEEVQLLSSFRGLPPERKLDVLSYVQMLYERYGSGQRDEQAGQRPKAGAVYEAVAGTPKAVNGKQNKSPKSLGKKSGK